VFQGEDLDVLADAVLSRPICRTELNALMAGVGRESGDRTPIWLERGYDLTRIKAATLVAHGGNDFNVMTEQAAQLYQALKASGTPHLFYFHQGGHGGEPPLFLTNLWLTRYLWEVENGIENLARSWVVRERAFCPPRATTVVGTRSRARTLRVASSAPFRVGLVANVGSARRLITNIPDATHVTFAVPVRRAVNGARVRVRCEPNNPTPYAEWPDPSAVDTVVPLPGRVATFTDDGRIDDVLHSPRHRLLYLTAPLPGNTRISGTPRVSLRIAFSTPKANVSVALVSFPGTGRRGTILTRGWIDPENRTSDAVSEPVTPGTFYTLTFALQPKDVVVAAGRRLGLMVFSTDREYTIRPKPGTRVTLDPAASTLTLPMIGALAPGAWRHLRAARDV
jgi:hypothetical protein